MGLFTVITILATGAMAWFSDRQQRFDDEDQSINAKHARQELRMIVYLLVAIFIMLGVIADRLR